MSFPTEKEPVELDTDQDWAETFEFYFEDETQPNDLSDAIVRGGLRAKLRAGEVRLDLTEENVSVLGNEVTIVVDRTILRAMPEGLYDFSLYAKRPGDVDEGLIRGKRRIRHGVAQ